ncbi:MAG: DUF6465 family protein [Clostridiales bacterium]|nr:DUF6465 family protein [Clostridiales bacterium]
MPRKASTKAAAAKTAKTEAPKRTAPMKPQVYLQYDANQVEVDAVVAAAKAAFKEEKGHRAAIKSLDVYLKPQEGAAYYVINGDFTGKIDL